LKLLTFRSDFSSVFLDSNYWSTFCIRNSPLSCSFASWWNFQDVCLFVWANFCGKMFSDDLHGVKLTVSITLQHHGFATTKHSQKSFVTFLICVKFIWDTLQIIWAWEMHQSQLWNNIHNLVKVERKRGKRKLIKFY
jgi:hypothetical protein